MVYHRRQELKKFYIMVKITLREVPRGAAFILCRNNSAYNKLSLENKNTGKCQCRKPGWQRSFYGYRRPMRPVWLDASSEVLVTEKVAGTKCMGNGW